MIRRFLHGWRNGSRWRILGWIILAAALSNVVFIGYMLTHQPYDPLGDYPIQLVELPSERGPADPVALPTLHLKSRTTVLPVQAYKCNNTAEPVRVTGQYMSWQLLQPELSTVEGPLGHSTRTPGCQQFNYRNPVPQAVFDRLTALHEQGHDLTVWQIRGSEAPIANDGSLGEPRLWQTENFAIAYEVTNEPNP